MLSFEAKKGVRFCDGLTRRDFLRVGSLTAGSVGLSLADKVRASSTNRDVNCILLFLVGGPSHLETFDMKPAAPANIRGPFRPIQTNVNGIQICEHLPRTARLADKFAILRSVHHTAAPIHETGHQLMQTGRLFRGDHEEPHYGAVVSRVRGAKAPGVPPFVIVPSPISSTGVSISHGQGAGYLGAEHEPVFLRSDPSAAAFRIREEMPGALHPENRQSLLTAIDNAHRAFDSSPPSEGGAGGGLERTRALNLVFNNRRAYDVSLESEAARERYGRNTFGQSCLLARRLVQSGVRFVTVNMFDTVFNQVTWDCHADGNSLAGTLDDYRTTLCPMFDAAYSSLLQDLHERGMLDNTLVVAMGEFGRTPHVNHNGGRDHWPGVWSVLFAGGGVRGGQVIGASDRTGSEPVRRPVTPANIAASVYRALGIDHHSRITGPDNRPQPIIDAEPVNELFA